MDWMADGLCKDDHDPWFDAHPAEELQAKEICERCPVRDECLDYALDKGIWIGVFGGLNPDERKRFAKQHGKKRHGSITGYTTDKCRCPRCKDAMTEYDRDKRPRKTERSWSVA